MYPVGINEEWPWLEGKDRLEGAFPPTTGENNMADGGGHPAEDNGSHLAELRFYCLGRLHTTLEVDEGRDS